MAKIHFFLLDLTYKIINDKAQICLFGRTPEGEKVMLFDPDFKPYFYVIPNKASQVINKLKKIKVEKRDFTANVEETEIISKDYLGEEVEAIKVYTNLPRAVPAISNEIRKWDIVKSCHEYDIKFTNKYLIDKGLTPMKMHQAELIEEVQGQYKVKAYSISGIEQTEGDYLEHMDILAFDIETYFTKNMPNPEKDPIIMISFYGSKYRKVITYKKFRTKHDYIEFVDDESHLLERFKEIIEKRSPDILTAYNSDGFDFPYIRQRAKKYKIDMDMGVDNVKVKFGRGNMPSARINGIIHIDIYQFVRRYIREQLKTDSLKLDNVAQEILGERKIEVDIKGMKKAWDDNKGLENYAEYNLQDSKLTYDLCVRFMPNIMEFTKLVSIPPFNVVRMGFSQVVERYLLKQAPKYRVIAPNKPAHDEIKKRRADTYPGGFVYQPTPGMYKAIVVLDFRSLYPTIISAHNIGPGTINCSCCQGESETAPTEKGKFWFCRKKRGFIPTIINDVISRRMRIKEIIKREKNDKGGKMLLDARQYSLKIMANSFYGYLAFFGSRWYSIECARSITGYARYYIKDTIKKAEEEGFNVIYSDTDSVFLTLGSKTKDDAIGFRDRINKELPGIMELELEGFFPSGIFVSAKMGPYGAKKKYALLSESGKMKITGFETVRSNWSEIAKEVQEEVLRIILKENDKEKALEYTKTVIQRLIDGKVSKDKIVMHTQLTKDISEYTSIGPHVAVAKKMHDSGFDVSPGTIITYIVCKGKGIIRDRVKMPEECGEGEYDSEYYINNQVIPSINKIFEVLGYDKKDLYVEGDQKDLKSFFS